MATETTFETPANTLQLDARSRLALALGASAIGLGVLADALLRVTPWGLNLTFWVSGLVAALWLLPWWIQGQTLPRHWPMLALAAVFAGGCAWRDSQLLKLLDVFAVVTLLGLGAWRVNGGNLVLGHLSSYLGSVGQFVMENALGCLALLFRDIPWARLPRGRGLRVMLSVAAGLGLALPLVALFAGLLSSADAAFRKLVMDLFDLDLEGLFWHAFITGMGAWVACGCLRAVLIEDPRTVPPRVPSAGWRLGSVEAGTMLASLNVVFLGFVIVQFQHFFGGAGQVEVVPGLTFAEYARRGFFELVTVGALVLPLLLLTDWLLRHEAKKRVFRLLAGALVAMVLVILVSAAQRMRLYQEEYGLTELRLYASAFMGWVAILLVWFGATVLTGRRERFAFGMFTSGLAAIASLHVINPDLLILRTNIARAGEGKRFDVAYATSLSADALPALVESLPRLTAEQQSQVRNAITRRWSARRFADWRRWSVSLHAAQRALEASETNIKER